MTLKCTHGNHSSAAEQLAQLLNQSLEVHEHLPSKLQREIDFFPLSLYGADSIKVVFVLLS